MMDTKQHTHTRKPFPVTAFQVTLQNIEQLAAWCKGTIVQVPTKMMGTWTDLPVIRLKGHGDKDFEASLGCWIVELKGNFRSYKPATFDATFDEKSIKNDGYRAEMEEQGYVSVEDNDVSDGIYHSAKDHVIERAVQCASEQSVEDPETYLKIV
jgi:hypothetical protein